MTPFLKSAPSAEAVFYRTYSRRKQDGTRESFNEAMTRCIEAIAKTGKFTNAQKNLVLDEALSMRCFPSGRAFWVAGTEWSEQQENFSGWYNCTSTNIVDTDAFSLIMELAMMGSGTGAVLEQELIDKLPVIYNKIKITEINEVGTVPAEQRQADSAVFRDQDTGLFTLIVGDSRQGWTGAYDAIIKLATSEGLDENNSIDIRIDLSNVRPSGERLKGFGGTSNPIKLADMFAKIAQILNKANGRKLTAVECCLLIDEAAACVVAGNIRRSAGMRQFSHNDEEAINAKSGLYKVDEDGNWTVDPEREALRMANHTVCYHGRPRELDILESVKKQFESGEGAIQFVPEAVARANADAFDNVSEKAHFMHLFELNKDLAEAYLLDLLEAKGIDCDEKEIAHRLSRYGLNPCGEIIGADFHCNLAEIHLNTLDPCNIDQQEKAFTAGALQVCALLHHKFLHERYNYSRQIDPIVGVSFTGLFDFFVHAFGADWIDWMMRGRPATVVGRKFIKREEEFLRRWRSTVGRVVKEYCKQHGLRTPNRCTTVQPAGTKSLLTGASSGWHPPKAQRFIRRITFGVDDPLVSALRDWGYAVVPAQSSTDDLGNLLDDITDPRVKEVLVEIPTEVSWANLPGCDQFDLSRLPIEAQWGLYMAVQNHYTEHNTSATLEFRESEIEALSMLISEAIRHNKGYISAALLARFDANETFPRLPFEPISKEVFDRLNAVAESYRSVLPAILQKEQVDFLDVLNQYDKPDYELKGAAGCDSDKCLSEASKDADQVGQQI